MFCTARRDIEDSQISTLVSSIMFTKISCDEWCLGSMFIALFLRQKKWRHEGKFNVVHVLASDGILVFLLAPDHTKHNKSLLLELSVCLQYQSMCPILGVYSWSCVPPLVLHKLTFSLFL